MKFVLGLSFALAGAAHAGIVSVGGDAVLIAQPGDARLNVLTSSSEVYAWNEAQNVVLDRDVRADAVLDGLYDAEGDLDEVIIAKNTVVSSHYIHFDSPGSNSASAAGSVTVDADILGVIVVNERGSRRLDASDFLGSPTKFTAEVNARGLELGSDTFRIIGGRTVEFRFRITTPGDYMRIITAPAPGALVLAGLGLAVAARRRSR